LGLLKKRGGGGFVFIDTCKSLGTPLGWARPQTGIGWARPRTGISVSYAVIAWDNVG